MKFMRRDRSSIRDKLAPVTLLVPSDGLLAFAKRCGPVELAGTQCQRRDPVEIERIMRLELAEAARRVRRELDSTVVEFGYHRRTAQQAAADSFRQIAERFDEIVSKVDATLREVTDKLAQPLETARRALQAHHGQR